MFLLALLMGLYQPLHSQFVYHQTLSYIARFVEFSESPDFALLTQAQLINELLYDGTSYAYNGQIYIPSIIEDLSFWGEKLVATSGNDIY